MVCHRLGDRRGLEAIGRHVLRLSKKLPRGSAPTLLEQMRKGAAEAEGLFSNRGKVLRERTTVAGLLRALGLEYSENEILSRARNRSMFASAMLYFK